MPAPATKKIPRESRPASGTGNTRDRILSAAMRLFNEHGVQNVAVDHIAQALGISNGNLNYHFPRKRDLLRATLVLLQERMREALSPSFAAVDPQQGARDLIRILRAFWDFRFFFTALTFLLSKDEELRDEYFRFHDWALDTVDAGLHQMIAHGHFQAPRAPNTSRLLAENMWSQWLNWLRMQQIYSPSLDVPEGEALYDCALHHWSLLEPYFDADYARNLPPVFRALLLEAPQGTDSAGGSI